MTLGRRNFGAAFRDGDNFWVPGNYKNVLKRLRTGYDMICNLMRFMEERLSAEYPSDRSIKKWTKKWMNGLGMVAEHQGMVLEVLQIINKAHSERLELNKRMTHTVKNVVLPKLKHFKQYAKSRGLKEVANEFRHVQKPWAKAMKKVNKIKIIYHEACRSCFEIANFLESNVQSTSHGTSQITPEVREKARKRHEEYVVEVDRCRTVYEAALYELNIMKNEYVNGMKSIFHKCMSIEHDRLLCFHECLEMFTKAIDNGRNAQYTRAWANVDMALLNYSIEQDLQLFSATVGPGMPYKWPAFEEWENRPSQNYDE